jgi:hemolysin activation/secretion protein
MVVNCLVWRNDSGLIFWLLCSLLFRLHEIYDLMKIALTVTPMCFLGLNLAIVSVVQAQNVPPNLPVIPRELPPPTPLEDPETLIRPTPPVGLPNPVPDPIDQPPNASDPNSNNPGTFRVKRFVVTGSQIFSQATIDQVTQDLRDQPIGFAQVLEARSRITELYVDRGYITTGAYVPEQDFQDGADVQIAVVEGSLESIAIEGNGRLSSGYLRSRIANAGKTPLNREQLLEGLQLLRLNPLLSNLSATLEGGTRPGQSALTVKVQPAPSFDAQFSLNNHRSPSVGSFKRGVQLTEGNFLGFGDRLTVGYSNTPGSSALDLGYDLPMTPQDTTLSFNLGTSGSDVIEKPFDVLEIESKSRYYEIGIRHPLQRSTTSEVAMGLTFSHRASETRLGFENIGPFPLSVGADDQGRTKVSALRFFQELTKRSDKQVLAFRSQLSLGLNAFNATNNSGNTPDSQFFSWRGQAQWVKLIGNDADALLLLRADAQFADRPLLSGEQFGLGGNDSVRGYRQDALLTDNGLFASAEVRLPIARIAKWNSTLSLAPFLEFGHGWNRDRANPEVSTLFSGGVGLRWRMGNQLTAKLDWGIPFKSLKSAEKSSLQENGLYFSLLWNPF